MKYFTCFLLTLLYLSGTFAQQGVGINTNSPHASAALDVSSTDKGMLIPRMSQSQRNAIVSPANGLLVYQTDNVSGFYFYDGSAWTYLNGSGGLSLPLTISTGGTGAINRSQALNNLLPNQSGKNGAYLYNQGSNVAWTTPVPVRYYISTVGIYPSSSGCTYGCLGEISMWPPTVNFSGALKPCNGDLLSIAMNTALFSLLGVEYGGNGSTTFALPNFNNATPVGKP